MNESDLCNFSDIACSKVLVNGAWIMSLNKSGKYLGKEDGPSNDKFSIFSLDSTFLPNFFAAQSENDGDRFSVKNQNQLNLSSTNTRNNFQNFFRKIGEHKYFC